MNRTQIDELFDGWFNGQRNFITPTVINRGKCRQFIYELSSGEGMSFYPRTTIYGVTVLELWSKDAPEVKAHRKDLSRCCHSRDEADEYIGSLRPQAKHEAKGGDK